MAILDDVKLALRINHTALDTEVTDLIAAARQDLILSGVTSTRANDDTDMLIKRAVSLYCKANFGWDNPDAQKLQGSYDMLKQHLSMSIDYAYYAVTFTINDGVNPIVEAEVTFGGEIKPTNTSGIAVFNVRTGSYKYEITADEHKPVDETIVDITANTTITKSLAVI